MQDNILLTGSSGFLGKEIYDEFFHRKLQPVTIGRSKNNVIICDLATSIPDISNYSFSKIIHAAGKAHVVPKTEQEKQEFYTVNVTGTKNLLLAIERSGQTPESFIFISSVSVYGLEKGEQIAESFPLKATDSYGKSKIEAEEMIINWCQQKKVRYYILRLPLIAGVNPPGNLGAMIKGMISGKYLRIGNADAKKSVVLASDVAKLIAEIKGESGMYNLTDGYHPSFKELENKISADLGKKPPLSIPLFIAQLIGIAGDIIGKKSPVDSKKINKIISTLTFSDEKARNFLNWKPNQVLDHWKLK